MLNVSVTVNMSLTTKTRSDILEGAALFIELFTTTLLY